MAKFKSFGQSGLDSDVQYGKRGGRLKHDSASNDFFFRDADDTFYLPVHGGEPTEPTHFATKQFVDDATAASGAREFYGIFVGETDGTPVFDGIEGVKFNSSDFYVTQNAPNTDEAIINLRGSFRDPLFRKANLDTAALQSIGAPLPVGAEVTRVKLVITEEYSTNAVEIVIRSDGSQIYMPADENDPTDKKQEIFISEVSPVAQAAIDGTRQVQATISAAPTAGKSVVVVEYVLP